MVILMLAFKVAFLSNFPFNFKRKIFFFGYHLKPWTWMKLWKKNNNLKRKTNNNYHFHSFTTDSVTLRLDTPDPNHTIWLKFISSGFLSVWLHSFFAVEKKKQIIKFMELFFSLQFFCVGNRPIDWIDCGRIRFGNAFDEFFRALLTIRISKPWTLSIRGRNVR